MGRLLAIGDIHGCCRALDALLAVVAPAQGDVIVPMGDLIDRGPDSKGVIERMIQLQSETTLVPLRGNHEMMMLQARGSQPSWMEWLGLGGDATLDSYSTASLTGIPVSHWQFIGGTKPFYEAPNHFLVHAKAYGDLWLSDDPDRAAFSEAFDGPLPHSSSRYKIMICGHTRQPGGLPRQIGRVIYLDTAAHAGGWLTCLNVDSMEYWQANERLECRKGALSPALPEHEDMLSI